MFGTVPFATSRNVKMNTPVPLSLEPPTVSSPSRFDRLRISNTCLSAFHLLLACMILGVGDIGLFVRTFDVQLEMNNNDTKVASFLLPTGAPTNGGRLYFTWLTAAFFMISSFFHFANAFVWRNAYMNELAHQRAPYRWCEYFFSASIMMVAIAYLAGVIFTIQLFYVFILTATTMLFGYLTEVINRPATTGDSWCLPIRQRLLPHLFGWIPQLSAWVGIMYTYLGGSVGYEEGQSPPTFVAFIIFGEFCLFMSFAFVQIGVLLRPPSKYVHGEYAYQILSLVSKGTLGIILLTNVLFLGDYECVFQNKCE